MAIPADDVKFPLLDDSSTAAPSPALTAASPWQSPWQSPWSGYLPGVELHHLLDTESLLLPDTAPEQVEFKLEGMEELHGSLAGLLNSMNLAGLQVDEGSKAITPPPGLELLAPESPATPPGLDFGKVNEAPFALPSGCVTAMLRNIPNKYSQAMLVEQLHKDYKGDIDFLYLPVDFKNKCNVGYCFLNFRTPEVCARFVSEFHGKESRIKLPGFNSKKVCEVSPARVQGCEGNVRRLRCSPVISQLLDYPEWMPQLFDEQGRALEFPVKDDCKGHKRPVVAQLVDKPERMPQAFDKQGKSLEVPVENDSAEKSFFAALVDARKRPLR
jgi:hypothetical protein